MRSLILGLLIIFFTGCSELRKANVPQYTHGTEKSKDWIKYNKFAKLNDAPLLDFMATSLRKPKTGEKTISYDKFLKTDNKVYFITKWRNVKRTDFLEYKIYTPDGRLYDYFSSFYKWNTSKWNAYPNTFIDKMPISYMTGDFYVDVFMNKKMVIRKKFTIERKTEIKAASIKGKIILFPFLNSIESKRKHSIQFPKYLSWKIIKENKNIEIVHPRQINRNFIYPTIPYNEYKNYIKKLIQEDNSILYEMAYKYNTKYLLLGKAHDTTKVGDDKEFTIYLLDLEKEKIIYENKIVDESFNSMQNMNYFFIQVYNRIYDNLAKEIDFIK